MVGVTYGGDNQFTPFNYFKTLSRSRDLSKYPLRVLLLYAEVDHGDGAGLDKAKIQSAYRNFRDQGAWVRLNPDRSYLEWVFSGGRLGSLCRNSIANCSDGFFPDNEANTEPRWTYKSILPTSIRYNPENVDTENVGYLSYEGSFGKLYKLGGIAEMMDRTQMGDWSTNLTRELYSSAPRP